MRVKAVYTGPFFTNPPGKTFRRNLREFIKEAIEASADVAQAAAPIRSGRYRDSIQARTKSLSGKPWAMSGVVSTARLAASFPGSRYGRPYFNYSGRVEARHKSMRKGRRYLLTIRRQNKDLLRGIAK